MQELMDPDILDICAGRFDEHFASKSIIICVDSYCGLYAGGTAESMI